MVLHCSLLGVKKATLQNNQLIATKQKQFVYELSIKGNSQAV
jgi:hypothetical protein